MKIKTSKKFFPTPILSDPTLASPDKIENTYHFAIDQFQHLTTITQNLPKSAFSDSCYYTRHPHFIQYHAINKIFVDELPISFTVDQILKQTGTFKSHATFELSFSPLFSDRVLETAFIEKQKKEIDAGFTRVWYRFITDMPEIEKYIILKDSIGDKSKAHPFFDNGYNLFISTISQKEISLIKQSVTSLIRGVEKELKNGKFLTREEFNKTVRDKWKK